MKTIHIPILMALALMLGSDRSHGALAAQWQLNGNTNDSLGQSNGVATNVQWVSAPNAQGVVSSMAYFNGTASVSVAPNSHLYMPSSGFSVTAWIRADTFAGTGENSHYYILDAGGVVNVSESAFNFGFSDRNINHQISGVNDYPTNSQHGHIKWYQEGATVPTSHILDAGTWYLLGLTYDGANAHAYIDGVEMTNFITSTYPLVGVAPYQFAQPLLLGASHGGDPKFRGYMYDVTLYGTPLTSTEMAALAVPEPSVIISSFIGAVIFGFRRSRRSSH